MPEKRKRSVYFVLLLTVCLLLWGCSSWQEEHMLEEAKIQEADAGEEDSPDPEESAAGENEDLGIIFRSLGAMFIVGNPSVRPSCLPCSTIPVM